ncbi:hypothetical protein [Spirosoma endophyticum]|uniref:Uncharacterized protein n=1 Tax=Spirosoma endophyticum TaxID=662367 RepID=A0A1I1T6S7_9BACT|nr:hypothetical protein [Spirosoma endophyticum]SFD54319.1 hypothetical protein SAMN05216167_105365 [Spirosoma endophyticum]
MKGILFSILAIGLTTSFLPLPQTSDSIASNTAETGSPILPIQSSNWVAMDGAGRTLPDYKETGGVRRNKYVGMFYFLWHGQHKDSAIYDITTLTKANPKNIKFGPVGAFHWWGEPEVGYFKADDPWVIRRNLQLLTLAGVDILFFDVTNREIYLPVVSKLCEISLGMRNQGIPTPYICFVPGPNSANTVTAIYQQFYAQNRYSDLWFRWQGKPLLLGRVEEITDATIRDYFTWRFCWAFTNARNEPHHWQWIDTAPQDYGWDKDPAIPEEIPVGVASHPNQRGKSFQKGREPANTLEGTTSYTHQGLYFDEQWKRALQVDPAVVFVTGWNEWVAQRQVNMQTDSASKANSVLFMGKPMKYGQTFFADQYNQEYNRDIDPMKNGYTDNYYYQLVANVRRFKGMAMPEPTSSSRTISIDGQFGEWATITPNFNDPIGDVMHRNWPRVDNKTNYINNTGRNDIIGSRVTYDAKNVYFYAKTGSKLSSSTDKNWMLLFVDADQSAKTGWAGYDFLINQTIKGNQTSVSRWTGKSWQPVAKGAIRYTNKELEISVPLSSIHQNYTRVKFDFHWADNIQRLNSITEFFLSGDSAPDRRFNYRYISK